MYIAKKGGRSIADCGFFRSYGIPVCYGKEVKWRGSNSEVK